MERVAIIGASHAGVQSAASLRERGFMGSVTLLGAENRAPYHRPPLSKAFLKDGTAPQELRSAAFFADKEIGFRPGVAATAIDTAGGQLTCADGTQIAFDGLVYAAGSRVRRLPGVSEQLANVHYLKDMADGERLAANLRDGAKIVVIGGGFIGLEVAATAAGRGCHVTVLEMGQQLMGRAVSRDVAAHFTAYHESLGIDVRLECGFADLDVADDAARAVITTAGDAIAADAVLVGIGVLPNAELAEAAGLDVENGVLVDDRLRSSHPCVVAIGDCANVAQPDGTRVRLESVQAATDQAKHAAGTLMGDDRPYTQVPWFWSDQGSQKLQMAGLWPRSSTQIVRGDQPGGAFSVWHMDGEQFAGVEAVNMPADYMLARRLLEKGIVPTRDQLIDPAANLKALLKAR
ncbi:MAG: FAD-dependent oxidoreductase [Pseudomonadota bacterium]